MKTVGIIGGLGPETTAKFYSELISLCYKKDKTSRPPILIWSVPLPYKIEEDLITGEEDGEEYLPYLIAASRRLENGGADFLVMPCNTLHIFIKEIRDSVKIPVLSIVEETVKFLMDKDVKEVAILATATTVKHELYRAELNRSGINSVLLDENTQERLGKIIHKLVLSQTGANDKKELFDIVASLSNSGKRTVLLACTDLQLAIGDIKGAKVYDTMKILANATVKEILG